MFLLKKIPTPLKNKYDSWKTEQQLFVSRTDKQEEYFFNDVEGTGTLYKKKQVDNIEDQNLIPFSTNFIYPIVKHAIAVATHQEPSNKIVSSYYGNDKDKEKALDEIALACDAGKHTMLRDSQAMVQNEEVVKMCFIRGKGIAAVNRKKTFVDGEYKFRYQSLHPSNIILDPNNTSRDFNEGEGYFIETEMTYDKFLFEYGDVIADIEANVDKDDKKLWMLGNTDKINPEMFCRNSRTLSGERNRITQFQNKTVTVTEFVDKIITDRILYKSLKGYEYTFRENLNELQWPSEEQIVAVEKGLYVRRSLMFGNYLVQIYMEPITVYPANTIDYEWAGKTYKVYGLVHFMIGMQEGYDKFIQMMILNGMLINNAGWKAPKNSIAPEDVDQWKKVDPRIIKFYTPIEIGDQVFVPEREQPQQLSNFYPMMAEMLKNGMEYVSSINSMMMGNPEQGIEVFSAIKTYYNFAMEKIMLMMRHINHFQMNMGEIIKQYMIAELEPNVTYIGQIVDVVTKTRLSPDQINLLREAKLKLIAMPAQALPSQKAQVSDSLFKMGQATADPIERKRFSDHALLLSGIPEAKQIVEEANIVQQMSGRVSQLEEENKRFVELLKQSQNRYINAKEEALVATRMTKFFETVAKAEATLQTKLSAIGIIGELKQEIDNLLDKEKEETPS